jgi:hypothetical protein
MLFAELGTVGGLYGGGVPAVSGFGGWGIALGRVC